MVTGAWYPFDIHNMTGHGQDPSEPKDKVKHYTIPYRCFLPETIDNLLFTGRCISGTHLASSSFRMMPICFAMGQATGTAASISVNKGLSPADIDIKLLQRTLLSQGVEAPDVSGC
ncbi:MAG: FAD-dependent oxidoreductase [Clostridiaceae bacterium]|nr:FAD-dependent oxidoreductase [Clostridiaceae bacterium]